MTTDAPRPWPRLATVGLSGVLVSFGDRLSEPANRAALAFRAAVDREGWSGVEETSTSLVSCFVRVDPLSPERDAIRKRLADLAGSRDWTAEPLARGRRLWRVPTVYGTDLASQLAEAAEAAGLSEDDAIRSISGARVRVQTIGFAPGQPYLGELPPEWDIPRQTDLTPKVPKGALALAIRQMVLFSVAMPTGWRHVGQTALDLFRPDAADPFVFRPGDEVIFEPVDRAAFERLAASGPDGGAVSEALA